MNKLRKNLSLSPIQKFIKAESFSGLLLFVSALIALIFSNLPSLKKLRISKFNTLVKCIDNFFYKKNFDFKMKNTDLICLKNKNVTENILKILK